MSEGRIQPQNLEAEENTLGAMMMSPNAIDAVADILEPADFYRESHGLIFKAMLDMHAKGEPVDAITLIDDLERRGTLKEVDGKVRVHELARLVPSSANVKRYASIVLDASQRRKAINVGHAISELGWEGSEDLAAQAEEWAMTLAPKHTEHETVFRATDLVAGFKEKLDRAKIIDTTGVPAPWEFLGRMKGSRLYVLAGYTGDGKSAAGIQFLSAACKDGAKVCLATNEMSAADLTDRLVSTFGIPHHACADPSGMTDAEKHGARNVLAEIEKWDFTIVDDEALDLATLRRHVRIQRPQLLIVDHLHRFQWKERRELEITIRGITNLAREFDIPVLLLAQLNRAADYSVPFPRPSLIRLRETAILEQEAWAVWFVWRPRDEFYKPGEHTEFLIAKDRGGQPDFQNMTFVPQYVRFDYREAKP